MVLFLQLKSVCSKLREVGVRGHLGVFGVYYKADNSRLYVVCSKQVPESQLQNEFGAFGVAEVKLNKDVNGFSKVGLDGSLDLTTHFSFLSWEFKERF